MTASCVWIGTFVLIYGLNHFAMFVPRRIVPVMQEANWTGSRGFYPLPPFPQGLLAPLEWI